MPWLETSQVWTLWAASLSSKNTHFISILNDLWFPSVSQLPPERCQKLLKGNTTPPLNKNKKDVRKNKKKQITRMMVLQLCFSHFILFFFQGVYLKRGWLLEIDVDNMTLQLVPSNQFPYVHTSVGCNESCIRIYIYRISVLTQISVGI